jgi:hypothetical protein
MHVDAPVVLLHAASPARRMVVSPWIAALHPANALVLFWAAFTVARGSAAALDGAPGAASQLPVARARKPQLAPGPA